MLKLFVPKKAASHRQERVAEEVRFLLAQQIQRDCLPIERDEEDNLLKPNAPITITHVSISPDLRHAQIGVIPLGGLGKDTVARFMNANAWHLKTFLSKQLKTRVAPDLHFYLDDHFDQVAKIDAIIGGISKNEGI